MRLDLPGHGRSRDILRRQSSFHTRTGTWRIGTVCPSTPDETARRARGHQRQEMEKEEGIRQTE